MIWQGAEICFFLCEVNNARFRRFPVLKFYDISAQQRQSVSSSTLSEQNFENFTMRGRFSKKNAKIAFKYLQVLRLQAIITPQWLQKPKTDGQMGDRATLYVSKFVLCFTNYRKGTHYEDMKCDTKYWKWGAFR